MPEKSDLNDLCGELKGRMAKDGSNSYCVVQSLIPSSVFGLKPVRHASFRIEKITSDSLGSPFKVTRVKSAGDAVVSVGGQLGVERVFRTKRDVSRYVRAVEGE